MKTGDPKYEVEITSLKEKRKFNVLDICIHIHETNNQIFMLTFEKEKGKIEAYESEYATDIQQSFKDYRNLADDFKEKAMSQLGIAKKK